MADHIYVRVILSNIEDEKIVTDIEVTNETDPKTLFEQIDQGIEEARSQVLESQDGDT